MEQWSDGVLDLQSSVNSTLRGFILPTTPFLNHSSTPLLQYSTSP